ncbi:TPA: helix-turn-helix transcriptional regulator [Clostridioides difficile]|uniref:helix-turn-helix transcriptional regulator n=1 Tax=Clostridioides difficile TaxID=1496 RepID=UPI001C15B2A9|nr:helix-turn-helix transcriptional regulator [Clostridioides difficile]MBY1103863.1 helix-turn-helix transcriptional regulator [Clostridioides difficile]MDC9475595.1 helix-turn-helix transcriptional regulator [Clostridioides difficile]HBG1613758.1 helix-turn-helix transcriptional regulator [Clostridioides difficile]HBG3682654.1 helix-turn-helix transcriptional regulator [Clostridioides difficile]HCQ5894344.1 helix-turn-helix transcriptional regulator [Clostridioides difficile]
MKLKLKRIEKGIKQYELAQKVGISRYYLSSLERSKSKNPSNMLMLKLAQELDTSIEDLFFDKGE